MFEFVSQEGTRYIWEQIDNIVDLTPQELILTKVKVKLMSDHTILNQVSGNHIQMGIPLYVNDKRRHEIYRSYKRILSGNPNIRIETHAIDRLIDDSLLSGDDPNKRGWVDEEDIRQCVRSMYSIVGIRLNVNHHHRQNTSNKKYLHPQIALTIKGKKADGEGRVVTAVLTERDITVITIL